MNFRKFAIRYTTTTQYFYPSTTTFVLISYDANLEYTAIPADKLQSDRSKWTLTQDAAIRLLTCGG